MTAADPRVCCAACELDDSCRDLFCSCHDGIVGLIVGIDPDELLD